jgi:hypothetical protein
VPIQTVSHFRCQRRLSFLGRVWPTSRPLSHTDWRALLQVPSVNQKASNRSPPLSADLAPPNLQLLKEPGALLTSLLLSRLALVVLTSVQHRQSSTFTTLLPLLSFLRDTHIHSRCRLHSFSSITSPFFHRTYPKFSLPTSPTKSCHCFFGSLRKSQYSFPLCAPNSPMYATMGSMANYGLQCSLHIIVEGTSKVAILFDDDDISPTIPINEP